MVKRNDGILSFVFIGFFLLLPAEALSLWGSSAVLSHRDTSVVELPGNRQELWNSRLQSGSTFGFALQVTPICRPHTEHPGDDGFLSFSDASCCSLRQSAHFSHWNPDSLSRVSVHRNLFLNGWKRKINCCKCGICICIQTYVHMLVETRGWHQDVFKCFSTFSWEKASCWTWFGSTGWPISPKDGLLSLYSLTPTLELQEPATLPSFYVGDGCLTKVLHRTPFTHWAITPAWKILLECIYASHTGKEN